jgi:hypothetical protein
MAIRPRRQPCSALTVVDRPRNLSLISALCAAPFPRWFSRPQASKGPDLPSIAVVGALARPGLVVIGARNPRAGNLLAQKELGLPTIIEIRS